MTGSYTLLPLDWRHFRYSNLGIQSQLFWWMVRTEYWILQSISRKRKLMNVGIKILLHQMNKQSKSISNTSHSYIGILYSTSTITWNVVVQFILLTWYTISEMMDYTITLHEPAAAIVPLCIMTFYCSKLHHTSCIAYETFAHSNVDRK